MKAIFIHKLSSFLRSPFQMISFAILLVILNLFLWILPSSSILSFGFADLSTLYFTIPYIFIILIPSIFMGFCVADFNQGTSDWLFSKPLSPLKYWMGHFMAGIFVILLFIILTITSFISVYSLASESGQMDISQIGASYFGVFLLALLFGSISTFASSISKSQAASFLLAVLICYTCYAVPGLLSDLPIFYGSVDYLLNYFSIDTHIEVLARGILELRTLIYFISMTFLFATLSIWTVQNKLR